ncbi:uncharacterized protein BDV14DRAFT_201032 [Aspergillus stella-maris]|uniref:uncharacterized protein n=1 Tax=Aspergillus stella-maris TaxID=1810926 RepID=UPI003CCDAE76
MTTPEQHLPSWRKYLDSSEVLYNWLKTLPNICEFIGMSSAKLHTPKIFPAMRVTALYAVLGVWEELSYKLLDERPDRFLGSNPKLREMINGFRKEVAKGAALGLEFYITVARK